MRNKYLVANTKHYLLTLILVCVAVCADAAAPNNSSIYYQSANSKKSAPDSNTEEVITITFKTGSGDGTEIFTSTACSTIVSEGASYLSGNVAAASKAYHSGKDGLKLGISNNNNEGKIKMNLASTMTPTSIVVRAKRYSTSVAATLKVNNKTAQSLTSDFDDYTFTFNGSSIDYIELTSSKYCWISSITMLFPHHTATFSVNGNTSSISVQEGKSITFPDDPSSIYGKTFCGWTTTPIDGAQATAPTLVSSAKMGNSDLTYYAVFADESYSTVTISPNTTGFPTSYGTAKTFMEYNLESINFMIQQIYVNNGKLQWRPSGDSNGTGTMYNSDALNKLQRVVINYSNTDQYKNISLTIGNAANPTNGTTITPTTSNLAYTYDCSSYNCSYFVLSNGNYAGYVNSIVIDYMKLSNFSTDLSVPSVTLNVYGYATCCSQFPLDFTSTDGYSAWKITGVSGSSISFTQVTSTVAVGTGLLLMGEPSTTITMTIAESGSNLDDNLLFGTLAPTTVEADQYYGLKGNEFVKVTPSTVPAGKALLPASEVGNVKSFTFVFNAADGINTMGNGKCEMENDIFNIAGQRLDNAQFKMHNSQLHKGVYIVNGKKILIK